MGGYISEKHHGWQAQNLMKDLVLIEILLLVIHRGADKSLV